MANQRQYSILEMRRAIEAGQGSPARIAAELGCARSTVYAYVRRYPELKAAFEQARGEGVQDRRRYPREAVLEAIRQSHGIKSSVAAALGCSRQTVDNYLRDDADLQEAFEAERHTLISVAVSKLVQDMEDDSSDGQQRAYMFVLKTIAKDDGFTERSELAGPDGKPLIELSPEQIAVIRASGEDPQQIISRLVGLLQRHQANGAGE